MRKRNYIRMLAFLLCLIMALCMTGCHKTRSSKKETINVNHDALTLYYIENPSYQGPLLLLGWYRTLPNNIRIEATGFPSVAELKEALEEGYPDILLLDKVSGGTSLDPFDWIQDGKIAGLNVYMEQDSAYSEENYIDGAMEAGKVGDEQYILPLSMSAQYLLINESELSAGTLSALGGQPVAKRLMEELVRDAQAHEDELYFTHVPFYMDVTDPSQWIYELLELSGALHVDHRDQRVTVDEALFDQTMKYVQVVLADQRRMYENGAELAEASFMDVERYCTAVLSDFNAPLMTRYLGSASHQLLEQHMLVLPYQLEDGSFVQNVNVMGMVGADSERQQEAYQVLRTMMDMPAEKWENLTVDHALAHLSPVNAIESQKLVDTLTGEPVGNYNILGSYIKREALTEEQAERLTAMLAETRQTYIVEANICNAIEGILLPYVQMDIEDWSDVAQPLAQAIEKGM